VVEGFVGEGTTDFYAVYPYSGAKGIDASNITVTLPSAQTSADGTFAEEHNISVAHGVKTPGEENVNGIKFDNVCGLIQFTVPKRISAVKNVSFKAENRALAGDLSVSKSELKVVSVANGSNTVNMTGSFAAGSTFYFVVAPGEVNGFSITVTAQNGATYSKTSTKSFTVEAAAMKNLGEIDFKAEPSAEAMHTYENGVLTGTKVTLTPGLPAGMEAYVENLTATLIKNGVEYRKISKSSVSASEVMDVVKGRVYVPQGEYVIEYTYTLNGVAETKTVNVTVPAPAFTVSASAYTSYSKYLEGTDASIAAANACTPESMYDITLSASISQSVLNNIPMTSNKGTIYKSNGEELDVLTENYNLSSPIFHLDGEFVVFAVFPVCCNKCILCFIKIIEQTGVQWKACAENSCYNQIVVEKITLCNSKRCGNLGCCILKILAYLIRKYLAYTLKISPEAHTVLLDFLVTYLCNELVEDTVVFAQIYNFHCCTVLVISPKLIKIILAPHQGN
jgi:hypothetical protein